MTLTPSGLKETIHHFHILLVFPQPRGAEQKPCTHERCFILAGPDHAATDEFIFPTSNKASQSPVNRTSTGHLPVARTRPDRLEEQLYFSSIIAGSTIHHI